MMLANVLITPDIGLMFWTIFTFLLMVVLLKKFAWKPIMDALQTREIKIQNALDAAKQAKTEMANLKAENEKLMIETRKERDNILREARDMRENIVKEAKDKAVLEAHKIIAAANQEIKNEKNAAVKEIKNQVALFSIEIAEKIITKRLHDEKEQRIMVEELIKEVHFN